MGGTERRSGSHVFIFHSPADYGWRGRECHLDASNEGCARPDEECMMVSRPLVSVVDDDESVRESLPDLLRELGFTAQAFASAEEFLASDHIDETCCLILDVAMPGMSGPDLVRE